MSRKVSAVINGGNWIYPSEDSLSSVQYPIKTPLVLELFQQLSEKEKTTERQGGISYHLHGPRYLEVEITEGELRILTLKNKKESAFESRVDFECNYTIGDLARKNDFGCYGEREFDSFASRLEVSSDSLSIFVTSVLLQEFLKNGNDNLLEEIVFRNATIPEIESIGRW